MATGLSERDRRRLERGRELAAVKMAAERQRIAKLKAREARERETEAQRRSLLGPLEVVGPDKAVVRLTVFPSGVWGIGDGSGDWHDIPVAIAMALANLFSHWVFFRGGSTVHVEPAGGKRIKIRTRSEAAAAGCLREIAEAVTREGAVALDRWRGLNGD